MKLKFDGTKIFSKISKSNKLELKNIKIKNGNFLMALKEIK